MKHMPLVIGIALGAAVAATIPYFAQAQGAATDPIWNLRPAPPISSTSPSAAWLFNTRTGEVWFCQAGPPQCSRSSRANQ